MTQIYFSWPKQSKTTCDRKRIHIRLYQCQLYHCKSIHYYYKFIILFLLFPHDLQMVVLIRWVYLNVTARVRRNASKLSSLVTTTDNSPFSYGQKFWYKQSGLWKYFLATTKCGQDCHIVEFLVNYDFANWLQYSKVFHTTTDTQNYFSLKFPKSSKILPTSSPNMIIVLASNLF